jgi:hypothetical protein
MSSEMANKKITPTSSRKDPPRVGRVLDLSNLFEFRRAREEFLNSIRGLLGEFYFKESVKNEILREVDRYLIAALPFIVYGAGDEDGPERSKPFLFLATDTPEPRRRSYTILGLVSPDDLGLRHVKYIPTLTLSFSKDKNLEQERQSLQNAARALTARRTWKDFAKVFPSSKDWSRQIDLDFLFESEKLMRMGLEGRRRQAHYLANQILFGDLSISILKEDHCVVKKDRELEYNRKKDTHQIITERIARLLGRLENRANQHMLNRFRQSLYAPAIETLERLHGQRNTEVYDILSPRYHDRIIHFKRSEEESLFLCALLSEFPALASDTDIRTKLRGKEKIKELMALTYDQAAANLWEISTRIPNEKRINLLDFLRGKTEHELGLDVTKTIKTLIPFLLKLEPADWPSSKQDWFGFNRIIETDIFLCNTTIRKKGDVLNEMLNLHHQKNKTWAQLGVSLTKDRLRQLEVYLDQQGRSRFLPAWLVLQQDREWPKLSLEDLVHFSSLPRSRGSSSKPKLSELGRSFLLSVGSLTPMAVCYASTPLFSLLQASDTFFATQGTLKSWLDQAALRRHMTSHPANFSWLSLPQPKDMDYMRGDYALTIDPVASADQLLQFAMQLRSLDAFEYFIAHLNDTSLYPIALRSREDGSVVALAYLHEKDMDGTDHLRLEWHAHSVFISQDIHSAHGSNSASEPMILADLSRYCDFIEDQKLDASLYQKARQQLLRKIKDNPTSLDIIGHDPKSAPDNLRLHTAFQECETVDDPFYGAEPDRYGTLASDPIMVRAIASIVQKGFPYEAVQHLRVAR